MNETETRAINYFQSYQDYFWEWEIDHMFQDSVIHNPQDYYGGFNCIAIPDGMTIAYKEQMLQVLKLLAPTGLPSFGALVLTFLATNSGGVRSAVNEIFQDILTFHGQFVDANHVDFKFAEAFLKTLINIPAIYKKGKNRLDLFVFLFEGGNHNLSPKYSGDILAFIQDTGFKLNVCSEKRELTMAALSRDINTMALLHEKYPSVDALLTAWFKIEEVPVEPEDTEVETFSEDPDLIQELVEDPKTFFMGSLIKRIWSGINLPMHYVHPGEMPLGGISDITNKGKFDNLLMSEFANDDLIFLHRIANKEALFIRRETTPEEDLRTRIFLIDATIKSWGTPKILSYATAFSFIHHPKNEMHFQPYVLGATYHKLSFDSKETIIDGLKFTSPLLDAATALETFIDEYEEETIEITFFTTPKTLEHQNIRRIFNMHHTKFGSVITSDSQGNIDVYKLKSGAKRLSKHIQLPLHELWANPPRRKAQRKKREPHKIDTSVINYPVMYGFPTRAAINFTDDVYAYILQKNGDLFRAPSRNKGFQMVKRNIRFVTGIQQFQLSVLYEDELLVLFWTKEKHHMIFRTAKKSYVYAQDMSQFKRFAFKNLIVYEDDLYLVTRQHYNDEPTYTRFDVEAREYFTLEAPSIAISKVYKAYLSNHIAFFVGSVFTKITAITITRDLEVVFNYKHRLELITSVAHFEMIDKEAAELDKEFTVYIQKKRPKALFPDGSTITIDRNGIIIFESADQNIPKFYLSSYIGIDLALATDIEFAGNEYFKPDTKSFKKIEVSEFDEKYMEPFLQHILDRCN
jgi:hypothetical protein